MENTNTNPTDTTPNTPSTPNVETQSTSVPAETTETANRVLSQVTADAAIIKKEPVPEPVASTEPVTEFKPDYSGMIQGFIDGDLNDEDYAIIEKSGLSKQDFEFMASGYKALQEKNTTELHGLVGGAETYNAMKEFGATNLGEEEISAFNQALQSNNPKIAKIAVLGLKAMYEEAKGKPASMRVESDGSTNEVAPPFESQQELIRAMNDRRYGKDQNYTKEINTRRNKSGY